MEMTTFMIVVLHYSIKGKVLLLQFTGGDISAIPTYFGQHLQTYFCHRDNK